MKIKHVLAVSLLFLSPCLIACEKPTKNVNLKAQQSHQEVTTDNMFDFQNAHLLNQFISRSTHSKMSYKNHIDKMIFQQLIEMNKDLFKKTIEDKILIDNIQTKPIAQKDNFAYKTNIYSDNHAIYL